MKPVDTLPADTVTLPSEIAQKIAKNLDFDPSAEAVFLRRALDLALAATAAPAQTVTCQIYGHEVIGCGECNSNAVTQPAPVEQLGDLSTLIRRLVQALRKAAPDNDLADKAMDYLQRKGLTRNPLRDIVQPVAPEVLRFDPTYVHQLWATARKHDSVIPSDVLDAMRTVLMAAPEQQREDSSDVSYELVQDGAAVAITSGIGAYQEILHYAKRYEQDGPIEIFKLVRTPIAAVAKKERQ